MLQKEIVAE